MFSIANSLATEEKNQEEKKIDVFTRVLHLIFVKWSEEMQETY